MIGSAFRSAFRRSGKESSSEKLVGSESLHANSGQTPAQAAWKLVSKERLKGRYSSAEDYTVEYDKSEPDIVRVVWTPNGLRGLTDPRVRVYEFNWRTGEGEIRQDVHWAVKLISAAVVAAFAAFSVWVAWLFLGPPKQRGSRGAFEERRREKRKVPLDRFGLCR